MAYKDKDKQRAAWRRYYYRNKEKVLHRNRENRYRKIAWLKEYKSLLICTSCGYTFKGRESTCDFHHVSDDKEASIYTMVSRHGRSIESIKKEIEKCIPLCANCHRIEHYHKEK